MCRSQDCYKAAISRLLSVVRLKLELKRILKYLKMKQTLGEVDCKLGLLDANGFNIRHY